MNRCRLCVFAFVNCRYRYLFIFFFVVFVFELPEFLEIAPFNCFLIVSFRKELSLRVNILASVISVHFATEGKECLFDLVINFEMSIVL